MNGSLRDYAAAAAVQEAGVQAERAARADAERPGVEHDVARGRATVTSEPTRDRAALQDIPALLRQRGIDPDAWTVEKATVNQWQSAAKIHDQWVTVDLYQLKVVLKAKLVLPEAARTEGPIFRPVVPFRAGGQKARVELLVVLPDQQVQGSGLGYDPKLHELVCHWLERNTPDHGVLSGDFSDFQQVSRFLSRPVQYRPLNEMLTATYQLARDYVSAAGAGCRWRAMPGNHEQRWQDYLLKQAPELYGLARAGDAWDVPSVLSLPYLLRFDELGIEWVAGPVADWPDAQAVITPKLAVRHGWLVRKKSGQSAMVTLETLGHSVYVGHTHRQGMVYRTQHEIDGTLRTHVAVECGTLAQVAGGLGYAVAPDWQNGFATARLHADGTFTPGLATYVNGVLLWEGQRYRHDPRGRVQVDA